MTDCPSPDILSRFREGALPAEQTAGVERHLNDCQRCRDYLDSPGFQETQLLADLRTVVARQSDREAALLRSAQSVVGRKVGHYRIGPLLGEGGMARVYRALDEESGFPAAIKVLKPEYQAGESIRARFRREALSMERIHHENVVRIHGFPSEADITAIAMELLEGGSLRDRLAAVRAKSRHLPIHEIVRMAIEAARGVGAAHDLGMVHRDIKPSNLLLSASGTVKVADFGVVSAMEGTTWLTGEGHRIGTPAYMSPEQCKGETVNPASDIYSLGVTLFELATGRLPYELDEGSPFALMLKHIAEPAPDPRVFRPDVPHWLVSIILRCLDKHLTNRYSTGGELAEALKIGSTAAHYELAGAGEERPAGRVNVTAIREQLHRLPQRAIVSWAARCVRRVQGLNPDMRVERALGLAESAVREPHPSETGESLAKALNRINILRAASLKAAYIEGAHDVNDAAAEAARAAAAVSACAAAKCVADAAADAAFAVRSAMAALELSGQPVKGFWNAARRDFQKLLSANLGPQGTLGRPIPATFWEEG